MRALCVFNSWKNVLTCLGGEISTIRFGVRYTLTHLYPCVKEIFKKQIAIFMKKRICHVLLGQRLMRSCAVTLQPCSRESKLTDFWTSCSKEDICEKLLLPIHKRYTALSSAETRNLCLLQKQNCTVLAFFSNTPRSQRALPAGSSCFYQGA